eukprot:TRINITY_DN9711_c0_g1_i1.p1 TRINITY_DN9711_c0_g1~~TRINITY_DN9711_c0_g1_i1.p1  ORF type:complete len:492 (+),score=71.33 TRINITY_DN9711_c0_g1_i1:18-1493(+)
MRINNCLMLMLIITCKLVTVHAGIQHLDLEMIPPEINRYSFGFYTPPFFGSSTSYVNLNLNFSDQVNLDHNDEERLLEVALFHHDKLSLFGDKLNTENVYCCTNEAISRGLCLHQQQGRLIFDQTTLVWGNTDFPKIDLDQKIYYWNQIFSGMEFSSTLQYRANISNSGVWYLFLAHCDEDFDTMLIEGSTEWRNPFGYLPGQIFPYLPLFVAIASMYFIMLVFWVYKALKYNNSLLSIQHLISLMILAGLTESIWWATDYFKYNAIGEISHSSNIIGALFTALKLTTIRALLLLVAFGYSITRETITGNMKLGFISLIAFYLFVAVINEYIWVLITMGVGIPFLFEALISGLLSVANTLISIWIAYSMFYIILELKKNRAERFKLKIYTRLSIVLILALLVSVILYIVEFAYSISSMSDKYWKFIWLFDAHWEVIYLIATMIIAILWKPNQNNDRYSYTQHLDDEFALELKNSFETDSSDLVGLESSIGK